MKRIRSAILALLLGSALLPAVQAQARADYKIAPNDIIVIDVFGEKDLSKEVRVTATGKINYFLLDELEVAGKTTAEVKDLLTTLLDKDYLVEPKVTVDVKEYRVREVFVNGAVLKPGAISITGEQELTILGALARAGGTSRTAKESRIKFTRPGQPEQIFSMDQLKRETDPNRIIYLKPGDIIEVPETTF